jgi:ferritin-like protein
MSRIYMASSTISIEVDAETARAFAEANDEQRRKLQLLLKLRLRELTVNPTRSLRQIMDEMGQEAEARGLTPEILESLLHGE